MSETTTPKETISEIEFCALVERAPRTVCEWRRKGIAPPHFLVDRRTVRYYLAEAEEFKRTLGRLHTGAK